MTDSISNWQAIIDSRDVIARIQELEELLGDDLITEDDFAELLALRKLAEQGAFATDEWRYGATLVRDSYFVTYARDLAEELDLMTSASQWPYTCIDWEQAARELQLECALVSFDGVEYWVC